MNKTKSTKRALLMSALALLLCVSMLIGSTYAWFTDSAASSNNRIVSGKLAVDLLMYKEANNDYVSIKNGDGDIFSEAAGNGILWEPGKTEIVYLAVKNDGTLDMKYNILLDVIDGGLVGALEYAIVDNFNIKTTPMPATDWATLRGAAQVGDIAAGTTLAAPHGALEAGEYDYFALAVHMKEDAGNQYQEKNIEIDVMVQAGQLTSEEDSFGKDYDKLAVLANGAFQMKPFNGTAPKQTGTDNFEWTNEEETFTVSGLTDDEATVTVAPAATSADLVVTAGDDKTIISYDIDVEGQKDGSTVSIDMYIGTGLTNVVLYHEGVAMPTTDYSYDSLTGILTFHTTSFSVYSVAFTTVGTLPLASVTMMSEKELAEVTDVVVAQLVPSFGLTDKEANPLETGYIFTANQTEEEAAASEYANWHADFAVSFDKDVPTGSAALAGQYDAFSPSWFAFEAFDVDDQDGIDGIPANKTFRLLEAFAQINYTELCRDIKVFKCGAYSLNDEVKGTTMTVELRLYETYTAEECLEKFGYSSVNEETGEYKVVGVYHYTF